MQPVPSSGWGGRAFVAGSARPGGRELVKLGVRRERGPGPITARTVRHWCDEVAADVRRHGVAAIVYDDMFTDDERQSSPPCNPIRQGAHTPSICLLPLYGRISTPQMPRSRAPKTHLNPPFSRGHAVAWNSSEHIHIVPMRNVCHTATCLTPAVGASRIRRRRNCRANRRVGKPRLRPD